MGYFDNITYENWLHNTFIAWAVIGFLTLVVFLVLIFLMWKSSSPRAFSVFAAILIFVYLLLSSIWWSAMANKNHNTNISVDINTLFAGLPGLPGF